MEATLTCGQAFNWHARNDGWEGVVHGRWVRLFQQNGTIRAETVVPQTDWSWLTTYLQAHVNIGEILTTFPGEPRLNSAVENHAIVTIQSSGGSQNARRFTSL